MSCPARSTLVTLIVASCLCVTSIALCRQVEDAYENIVFEATAPMWDQGANSSSDRRLSLELLPQLVLQCRDYDWNVLALEAPVTSKIRNLLRDKGYSTTVRLGASWWAYDHARLRATGSLHLGGEIHVVYPIDVHLTRPEAGSFARGEAIHLQATAVPRAGARMETGEVTARGLAISADASYGGSLGGRLYLGTRTHEFRNDIPYTRAPGIQLFPNSSVWTYNNDRWEQLSYTLASTVAPLGLYGYLGYPKLEWSIDEIDPVGRLDIHATETFLDIDIDPLFFIDTKIPLNFTTDEIAGCQLDYSIVGATVNMQGEATQQATFDPRFTVRYEFSEPLRVDGELADHATVHAGPLVPPSYTPPEIVIPPETDGYVTVTPVISLDSRFTNSYAVQASYEASGEAHKYILKLGGFTLYERIGSLLDCKNELVRTGKKKWYECYGLYCDIPWVCSNCRPCWAWECFHWLYDVVETCLPVYINPWNVKGREISLGPLIDWSTPRAPAPADRVTETFQLPGFEDVRLDPFVLVPHAQPGELSVLCNRTLMDPSNEAEPIEYWVSGPESSQLEVTWTTDADWMPTGVATVADSFLEEAFTPPVDGSWWLHAASMDPAGTISEPVHYGPIVIDWTSPTIEIESAEEWLVDPVDFRILSSEPLAGMMVESFAVTGGTIASLESSSDGTDFHVRVRPHGTGRITLALSASDTAGNCSADVRRTVSFVDVLPPECPSLSSPSHRVDVWSPHAAVIIEASAADDVSGIGGYEIAWTQNSEWTPSREPTHGVDSWTGGTFEAPRDGPWYMHLAVVDGASNWSEAASIGPFLVDMTCPEATISSPRDEWTEAPVEFLVSCNERVSNLDGRYVHVDGGTVVGVQRTSDRAFRIMVDPHEQGTLVLRDLHAMADPAGNAAVFDPFSVVFADIVPPTLPTLSSSTHEIGVPSNVPDVTIEARGATDALSGIAGYEVVWAGRSWYPAHIESEGPRWPGGTYSTLPPGDRAWFLHVMCVDGAGNWSETMDYGPFLIDTAPPTIDIVADPWRRANVVDPVRFELSFSESVTELRLEDVEIENAIAGHWEQHNETDYALVVRPASEAPVVLRIPAYIVTDEAGNPNDASRRIEVPYFGEPRISEVYLSTSNPSGEYVKPGDRVTLEFQVESSGDLDDVVAHIGSCEASLAAASEREGRSTLGIIATCPSVPEETSEGEITFRIEVIDHSGLVAIAEYTTDGHRLFFDKTPPRPFLTCGHRTHVNDQMTFRIRFDEPVSDLDRTLVRVEGGSVSTVTRTGEGIFDIVILPKEGEDVSVRVLAAAVKDRAAYESTPSEELTVPFEPPAARLSDVSISTSNPSKTYCTIGDDVTVTFTAEEDLKGLPKVEIGRCDADVTYQGFGTYLATCVVDTSTREGEIDFEIAFESEYGKEGTVDRTSDGTYVVFDSEPPEFRHCPDDITTTDPNVYWEEPTAWDSGSGIASVVQTHYPGDTFPLGTTTIRYTATDHAGDASTCEFDVSVLDDEPPGFHDCPGNISTTTSTDSAVVSWSEPTAYDDGSGVASVTQTHHPGNTFSLGTTSVTYTATDNAGNSATCTFIITVFDNEPPGFTDCPDDITTTTSTDSAVVPWSEPTAYDDGSGVASVTQTHHPGDTFPLGTTTVIYTTTDNAGNAATCEFDVIVTEEQDAPQVTLSLAPWETDPTSEREIDFIAEFSEMAWGVDGDCQYDVELEGSAGADTYVITECSANSPDSFEFYVSGMTQTGWVIVTIPAGTAIGYAGSGNPNEESNTVEVWYEYVP